MNAARTVATVATVALAGCAEIQMLHDAPNGRHYVAGGAGAIVDTTRAVDVAGRVGYHWSPRVLYRPGVTLSLTPADLAVGASLELDLLAVQPAVAAGYSVTMKDGRGDAVFVELAVKRALSLSLSPWQRSPNRSGGLRGFDVMLAYSVRGASEPDVGWFLLAYEFSPPP